MSSEKTYTAAEVHSILESLLDGLAGNQVVISQTLQDEQLEQETKVFALGQASGLETAEDLITETLEGLK